MAWRDRKRPECEGCPLLDSPGPVWGVGPQKAKFIYIAERPQPDDVKKGMPLSGPAGNVFNRQCYEAAIERDSLFVTYQVKCMPGGTGEVPSGAIAKCKFFLQQELNYCKSDTVVLAGDLPFKANIGKYSTLHEFYRPETNSLYTRMGCVEHKDGRKWIGTLNPSFVMKMPDNYEDAIDHLKKADFVSGLKLEMPVVNTRPTKQEILEAVDHCILFSREFADDVETVGLEDVEEDDYVGADFQMTMGGISVRPHQALVLSPDELHLLAPIYADPGILCYEHNGAYDQYHLRKIFGEENMRNDRFDTMLGTHYLRSYAPKKLKPYVVSKYTTLPYYNRDLGRVDMRLYNGMDCIATFLAGREIKRQQERWGVYKLFKEVGMPMIDICEDWRRVGVRVDLRKAALFTMLTEEKIKKAEHLISQIAGPFFNPGSWQQREDLLYNKYNLPKQYKPHAKDRRRKVLTTDFQARKAIRAWIASQPESIRKQYEIPEMLLNLLDFISGEKKKLEYIHRISPDARIHPYYKTHGERPFRLSSTPNLQNFPVYDISAWGGARRDDGDEDSSPIDIDKDEERAGGELGSLRSLVLADHDEDLILTCDYEQLQLWLCAKIWGVKYLLSIYETGDYIYGAIYEKLYKEPFFEEGKPRTKKFKLKNIPEQRIRRAKAVPLGFNFGRTGKSVAAEYGWPPEEGMQLQRWYFSQAPEIETAHNNTKYIVHQKKFIRHVFGQIMHFPSLKVTEAINSYGQSNEAFVVQKAVVKINNELKRRGWHARGTRTMLSVHDSLSVNVRNAKNDPQHLVEVYEEVVKPILEEPIPELDGFKLRHSAEVSYMWDWDVTPYAKWKEMNIGVSTRG